MNVEKVGEGSPLFGFARLMLGLPPRPQRHGLFGRKYERFMAERRPSVAQLLALVDQLGGRATLRATLSAAEPTSPEVRRSLPALSYRVRPAPGMRIAAARNAAATLVAPRPISTARNGDTLSEGPDRELIVTAANRAPTSAMGWLRETGSDIIRGRIGEVPGDLGAFGGTLFRGPRGRAGQALAPGDAPNIPNLRPDDMWEINRHALFGDGSPRQVDFRKVDLSDLGPGIQKIAADSKSRLYAAIGEAIQTGKPVPLSMTGVNAGGGQGGKTGFQVGGIGRFSVVTNGEVIPTGNRGWTYRAAVTGEPDDQDYPRDTRRGSIAGPVNDAFGKVQSWVGGEPYRITFFGDQKIEVSGRR